MDFDEAYGEYQRLLILLKDADDIHAKNNLFRQLTELLTRMEELVASKESRRPALSDEFDC